jgi:hypothetical protein
MLVFSVQKNVTQLIGKVDQERLAVRNQFSHRITQHRHKTALVNLLLNPFCVVLLTLTPQLFII